MPHVAIDAHLHHARFLKMSARGVAFLIREEGVMLAPYRDSRGLVTARVGKLITPPHTTITDQDRKRYTYRSRAAAVRDFVRVDLPIYEQGVRDALGDALVRQAEFDMCGSLCFNIGIGGFARSQVARLIKQGRKHIRAAADAFYGWAKPSVLRPRRGRERARFLRGRWT
jgi:GH24 family phage-related lysozyme (muramidase)